MLNLALQRLHASFAETVRGLEPLFTAGFAVTFRLRGGALSLPSACSLLALICGAAMVCYAQPKISVLGLELGMAANLMFAGRAIAVSSAQDRLGRGAVDGNTVFFYQARDAAETKPRRSRCS